MAIIHEFTSKKEYYNKLYQKRLNEGDLLGAFNLLKSLERENYIDYNLYKNFGLIYFKMQLYEDALESFYKCLTIIDNDKKVVIYGYIGATYHKISNTNMAGYYIQKFLQAKVVISEDFINQTLADFIDEVTNVEDSFYLAYPYEKADFSKQLLEADELFKNGDYEGVIELLSIIPNKNQYYFDALLKISVCKFLMNKVEDAISDITVALEIEEDNVYALCNIISMYYEINDKNSAKKYLKKLDGLQIEDEDELYKVIMLNCEISRPKKAEYFGEKYLKINAYDKSVLHMLAIVKYNLTKFEESYKLFKKLYVINNTFVASSYLAICENAIKYKSDREYKKLAYIYDVPKNLRKQIIEKLKAIMKNKEFVLGDENSKEFFSLMDYCFECQSYQMQASALSLISQIRTYSTIYYLKNLLIKGNVYDKIKQGIVGYLLDEDSVAEVKVQVGGIYKEITLFRPYFIKDDKKSVFFTAYIYAFAKMCFYENNLKKLCTTCEDLYEKSKEMELETSIGDVQSLSAVIYELSNIRKIKNRRDFAKFFNANLRNIKKIKELFN